jgi:prophage antirepressor-like protein
MKKTSKIQLFQEQSVRTYWNEKQEMWYFSVHDVVHILSDSNDVKQYTKRMRSRDVQLNSNWGTICTPLPMMATDGKIRKILAANAEGLFRIIQSIPSPKAEPFKQWLAQVAAERLDEMQDPETFTDSKKVAKQGGTVAKVARIELEARTGKKVITSLNAKKALKITNIPEDERSG